MRVRSISDTIAYRGADVPERKERIIQQAPEEHDLAGEQLVITIEAEHDHEPPLTKKRPEKRPPPPPEPGGEAPHDARETVVLATMHGGATWNAQRPGTSQILTGVTFSDATHGWAVGQGGTILATTDGGAWRAQSSGTTATLYAVAFPDAAHGWAVGYGGRIFATTRGGE